MPSTNQGGNSRQPRDYDDPHKREAARFLDWDVLETYTDREERKRMVMDRIASIDRIEVLDAWLAVELDLERGDDGSPRKKIIGALNRRKKELEVIGERPDRLTRREEPRDLPPVETTWADRPDVEVASDRSTFMRTSRSTSSNDSAVATDGGVTDAE